MSGTEFGGYAPNPRKTRRNQIENTRSAVKSTAPLAAPKFLSEKARESGDTNSTRGSNDAIDNSGENAHLGVSKAEVPLIYRNVEIKYSRFGVDDFDFEYVIHTTSLGAPLCIIHRPYADRNPDITTKPNSPAWRLTLPIPTPILCFSSSNSPPCYATLLFTTLLRPVLQRYAYSARWASCSTC